MINSIEQNSSVEAVRLPIAGTAFGAYWLLIKKFKEFLILGSIYAVVLLLIYLLSGNGWFCNIASEEKTFFCSNNVGIFIVVRLLNFMVICMFARVWYQAILEDKFSLRRNLFVPSWKDIKIMALSIGYILSLSVAIYSLYLLYVRVPNPDWRIELAYFTFVSLGLIVPVVALRFLSWYAFIAEGEILPNWKVLWRKTTGNNFLILSSLVLLLIIGLSVSMGLLHNIMLYNNLQNMLAMLWSEFLSHIFNLLVVACFMNYCYLQKKFLFERK